MEEDSTQIHNRNCIVTCFVEFYQELYRSRWLQTNTMEPQQPHRPSMDDAPPIILPAEVEASIKKLDHSKAPGEDNIIGGVLQDGREAIVNLITQLFNKCLQLCQVPKAWQNTVMILLHKKGNTSDIKNYRPISLVPSFTKCFHTSACNGYCGLETSTSLEKPAGFGAGFSMMDHLPCCQPTPRKSTRVQHPTVLCICGL